jgi:hypothetical protein
VSDEQSDIAVFKASFPPIKSAILVSGDGTGGSIKLEIPQAERAIFAQLMDMCQDELIVTIARAACKAPDSALASPKERTWKDKR